MICPLSIRSSLLSGEYTKQKATCALDRSCVKVVKGKITTTPLGKNHRILNWWLFEKLIPTEPELYFNVNLINMHICTVWLYESSTAQKTKLQLTKVLFDHLLISINCSTGVNCWKLFVYHLNKNCQNESVQTIPIGSMYGIFTHIWVILMVNITTVNICKYTIHGSHGIVIKGIWQWENPKVVDGNCGRISWQLPWI